MMKVLIFSLSYFPKVGGLEVAIDEITSRIPQEEIEFDMVTMRFDKSHPKFERVGNINVYRIGGGLGYLGKALFVLQALNFARNRHYDLYWAMMTYMLFPVVLLRFFGRQTPYVLTLQDGDPFERVFNRIHILPFKPLLIYGFKNAFKIQVISNFLATWARQAGFKGEVHVIPNGVNPERFENSHPRALNSENVTLITTSRLFEKNAVGDIIEALKFLPKSISLKILGEGPLEKKLKSKAKELGVSDRTNFLGFVPQPEIPGHLHKADIFIRPSLSEGQGISFIEAMASGIPVIATPVGGIPDFLKDGETGLLVEPRSPRLIAFQVQKLISDRVLHDKIVIAAKRLVKERYDWDLIAKEMKDKVLVI
jgi:glycosyltransferase involved in cell wall biosynthesis